MRCSRRSKWIRSTAVLIAAVATFMSAGRLLSQNASGKWHDVSLAEYRTHLESLDGVVAACQKLRKAQGCDPAMVGPDDRVRLTVNGATTLREVRYDWLRNLLQDAGNSQPPPSPSTLPGQVLKTPPLSLDVKLAMARKRLEDDEKEADNFAAPVSNHTAQQKALAAILARKEYRGVAETSARERFLEWLGNQIDHLLDLLAGFGRRSPWIGFLVRALIFAVIGIALLWMLIRIERRSRTRLIPEVEPVAGAPSAREWQLWRADALAMAGQGRWRDAIHFLYWAAISRLESKQAWPADRARTPREYLSLMPLSDNRKSSLTTLTRSFERTWYGGRDASPSDFQAAQKLACDLGVE